MAKHRSGSATGRRSDPADAALEQAALALRMQRPVDAAHIAEGILKGNRGHVAAATLLGHALLAQNRAEDAVAHLERAARRSQDPALETLLASALAASGRRDEALSGLQAITLKSPAYLPAVRAYTAQLADMERIADAIKVISRAVAAAPATADLWLDLAGFCLRNSDRDAALDALKKARDAAPGRPDILAELARTLLLEGDYAAAAECYRHALALQPDHAMNRSNLAACQLELDQRHAGETSLRAAVKGRAQMIGRAIHALSASSHGRFFLRPSAAKKFLRGEEG